ncbi:Gp49 family protein [Marinobacter sp. MCTG268]|uniref:Gp49 family protein n=1 Tax=Marinobacter adhaerens TaxID=1033846 RepID=UPI0005686D73
MDKSGIEEQITEKGLTAPRVTPTDIEACIASEHYFTGWHGMLGAFGQKEDHSVYTGISKPKKSLEHLTFCVLVLKNGYTVTGESACASPENFDAEIGRNIARKKAVEKIWPLEGYLLKQRMLEQ